MHWRMSHSILDLYLLDSSSSLPAVIFKNALDGTECPLEGKIAPSWEYWPMYYTTRREDRKAQIYWLILVKTKGGVALPHPLCHAKAIM